MEIHNKTNLRFKRSTQMAHTPTSKQELGSIVRKQFCIALHASRYLNKHLTGAPSSYTPLIVLGPAPHDPSVHKTYNSRNQDNTCGLRAWGRPRYFLFLQEQIKGIIIRAATCQRRSGFRIKGAKLVFIILFLVVIKVLGAWFCVNIGMKHKYNHSTNLE
jgi:hypothetical protein